jgi:hypothetical protein
MLRGNQQAVRILKDAGIRNELASTTAPMSAAGIAHQAVQQGCGMVIAWWWRWNEQRIVNGLAGSNAPMRCCWLNR